MKLAENLKNKRKENNLSQEEVAKKLNISRQSISKWETGTSYPDIENLIKLSELYNISLDELIKGDSEFQEKLIIKNNNYSFLGIPQGMMWGIYGLLITFFWVLISIIITKFL